MNKNRGFIALISSIVIAAILLLAILSSGLVNFYSRFNALDSELKERSDATADACADQALLQLAETGALTTTLFSVNELDKCRVKDVGGSSFAVQATSSDTAVTNLRVVYDPGDFSVISWQEITHY